MNMDASRIDNLTCPRKQHKNSYLYGFVQLLCRYIAYYLTNNNEHILSADRHY